jgi:hypothetical protein
MVVACRDQSLAIGGKDSVGDVMRMANQSMDSPTAVRIVNFEVIMPTSGNDASTGRIKVCRPYRAADRKLRMATFYIPNYHSPQPVANEQSFAVSRETNSANGRQ